MLFCDVSIIDENFNLAEHRWVGVADGRIAYVGDSEPEKPERFGERYGGTNRLLMPALYNTHCHAPMTLLRGYGENLPLQAWLNDRIWPFEAKMTPEDHYWATLLSCAEMARFGTVGFSDMYFHADERIRAVDQAGMKANVSEALIAFDDVAYVDRPLFALNERLVNDFHGAGDGRIRIDFSIHAEYTSNPQCVEQLAAHAKDKGVAIHLHLSETKDEHEQCKQRHGGFTPLRYFDSLGVLDVPVVAAHCVWVDERDIELMAKREVYASCNPVSNMKLGSGFAPVPALLEAGVPVCLGTDGVASNNNLNMFQDLYAMALVYKGAALDPTVVSPAQALRAATRTGALAQGRADCGAIAEGMRADLCMLDTSGPWWTPATDVVGNTVFAGQGSDVVLTLCDGRVVYRDGEYPTIDVERAKAEVSARAKRICNELS